MKKKSLKESLIKMKYLAGLITENQMNEFYKEDEYFADDNKDFSVDSTEDVDGLFNSLINNGVVDFKFYPDWVFNALNDENYIEQKGDSGAWFLSLEGQSVFRDARKLQQYLVSADESVDVVGLDEEENGAWEAEQDLKQLQKDGERIYNSPKIKALSIKLAQSSISVEDLISKLGTFFKENQITDSDEIQTIMSKAYSLLKEKSYEKMTPERKPFEIRTDKEKNTSKKIFDKKPDTKWVDDAKKGIKQIDVFPKQKKEW